MRSCAVNIFNDDTVPSARGAGSRTTPTSASLPCTDVVPNADGWGAIPGALITFTALAGGCRDPEYRFSLTDANGQNTMVRDWSAGDSWAWTLRTKTPANTDAPSTLALGLAVVTTQQSPTRRCDRDDPSANLHRRTVNHDRHHQHLRRLGSLRDRSWSGKCSCRWSAAPTLRRRHARTTRSLAGGAACSLPR